MGNLKLNIFIVFFTLLSSEIIFTQENQNAKQNLEKERTNIQTKIKSNFEMYGTHFSIKNYELNILDKEQINQINFNDLEPLRLLDEDTEIFLPKINKTIVLFSKNKVKEYKLKNKEI
jgi:hypothetical protein